MYCGENHCPVHACMSDECQLQQTVQNAPHIVLDYGDVILEYCPHRDHVIEALLSLASYINRNINLLTNWR